jgi:hypothetical protein
MTVTLIAGMFDKNDVIGSMFDDMLISGIFDNSYINCWDP